MISDSNKINYWFLLCWFLVTCWLLLSAFLTHGEYGDGYTTITNGRYLFGDSLNYNSQRGPLAALAMWPVEFFINWSQWNLADIRPYHFYSGVLHSLYLLGCWILLKKTMPGELKYTGTAQLLAFIAAILSLVFYAFAPYLSHDIIPGLIFLVLIFLCHRWLHSPDIKTALWLVLIGSAVTFIKQTYALFWVVILLYALIAYVGKWDGHQVTARKLAMLLVLAIISGIISWLGYGLWLEGELPDESLFVRPWILINVIHMRYGINNAQLFSQDLYVRNIYNYGITVILLIIPGLVNAFYQKDSRLRMIAVCWLLSVIFMQLLTFKEVRYLLFLAPLTAVLIVPAIQYMLKKRILAYILAALILVDQARGLSLAAKQLSSTAGINISQFIDAPKNKGRAIVSTMLTFIYMADTPLERDLYHGIYHVTAQLLARLYEDKIDVVTLEKAELLGQMGIKSGDRVYWANTWSMREPPWSAENNLPVRSEALQLIAGDAEMVQLVRQNDEYIVTGLDDYFILFIPDKSVGKKMPVVATGILTKEQIKWLYGEIKEQEHLNVVAVIVKSFCQTEQCVYGKEVKTKASP